MLRNFNSIQLPVSKRIEKTWGGVPIVAVP